MGNFWSILVKVNFNKQDVIFGAIYRSPSACANIFFDYWESIMQDPLVLVNRSVLTGDFNICWKSDSANKRRLQALSRDAGFKQVVTNATRISLNTESIIFK